MSEIDIESGSKQAHKHNGNCSHDHGEQGHKKKGGKKNFMNNQIFGQFVVVFTLAIPTNCIILEYLVIIQKYDYSKYFNTVGIQESEWWIQTFLMMFFYVMAMWSYYQACVIKNNVVPRPCPPQDNRNMDPIYKVNHIINIYIYKKNSESCTKCSKWKPMRTHHCSVCGQCALKMDHHCPWIVNCVGLRNHRAFYLFTLYMMFGGLQYCWRSWVYFQILYASPIFFQHHMIFYAWWSFISIVLFPTACLLFSLFSYHSLLIMSNQTTLESMGSQGDTCPLPCLPESSKGPVKSINLFNRGAISNIAWFFENQLFTWWMPFESVYENDGTFYSINPAPTQIDVQRFQGQIITDMNQQFDLENISINFKEFIQTARLQYKGKKVVIDSKIIEIE